MVSGMVIARSRQVPAHARQPILRSSFRPAPMSATMTPISVRYSVSSLSSNGSGSWKPSGSEKTSQPSAT
jgi:hypothetical protein